VHIEKIYLFVIKRKGQLAIGSEKFQNQFFVSMLRKICLSPFCLSPFCLHFPHMRFKIQKDSWKIQTSGFKRQPKGRQKQGKSPGI